MRVILGFSLLPPYLEAHTSLCFQASSSAPAPAVAVPADSSFPSCISARVFLPLPGNQQRALQQTTEKQQARKRKVLETLLCTKNQKPDKHEGGLREGTAPGWQGGCCCWIRGHCRHWGRSLQAATTQTLDQSPLLRLYKGAAPKIRPRQGLPPHQGRHKRVGAPCHQQRLRGMEGLSPWFLLLPQAGCHLFLLTKPL